MTRPQHIAARAADEQGAVMVIFAVFAPVAILFAVFVIDASNWFLHNRHLQVQADAGVLAAAEQFQNCFTNSTAANAEIKAVAEQYSGIGGTEPVYNKQLGGSESANLHEVLNSQKYFSAPSNPAPEDTSAVEKPPCEANMVDLKVTETNLAWYLHPLSSVSYLNAHARVEILQETTATGVEPLAVAETAPVAAKAYFVDEDNKNAVLAEAPLEKTEVNAQGQDVWSNPSAPASVTINHPHIGVVIALSGNKNDTTCGHEYVECFGRKVESEKATLEKAEPALQIAGYPTSGTGTLEKPIVREQTLTPNTCTDGYFSNSGGSCTVTFSAIVDYGNTKTQGMTITPEVKGVKGAALTPPAGKNGQTEPWKGSLTVPAGTGSNEISLEVACKAEATSPCSGKATKVTAKNVHRVFAANTAHSGSIAGAWVGVSGGTPQDANTFAECSTCTQKLTVTVDVEGSFAAATGFSDPVHTLKFEGNHGVIVGCPPNTAGESASEFREHLERGCPGTYKINTSNPTCTVNTEPFDCLKVNANGKKTGAMKGFEARIEKGAGKTFYCANNWKDPGNGGVPSLPSDDSRIVQVFIMPYGSLNSSGEAVLANGEVQIQNFAAFYVTGFPGDSCKSDPSTGNTEVLGHFIKYINLVAGEGGGKPKCREDPLGECVAVLTR